MRASLKTRPAGALASALLICLVALGDRPRPTTFAPTMARPARTRRWRNSDSTSSPMAPKRSYSRRTWRPARAMRTSSTTSTGIPNHLILAEAIITMTHFWDADPGDDTPSTYGDFEGPVDIIDTSFIVTENAQQKARHFWTLALGSYAEGRQEQGL